MKIGFTGTVSVGKTTLVKALQQLPEFKEYIFTTERSKYLRDLGIPLNTDSTIKGQMIFGAERASELINPNIITDRTIIDVMAFTRLANSIPHYIAADYENLYKHLIPEYDYIFYISPEGIEIEDNKVRTTDPIYRIKVDKEIQKTISQYRNKIKHYYQISGSTEERIEQIKNILF
jgi:deoxyadenosine/deoxycytidine kinase